MTRESQAAGKAAAAAVAAEADRAEAARIIAEAAGAVATRQQKVRRPLTGLGLRTQDMLLTSPVIVKRSEGETGDKAWKSKCSSEGVLLAQEV